MNFELFFTLQNAQNGQGKLPIGDNVQPLPVEIQGAQFIDLILTRLIESSEEKAKTKKGEEGQLLDSENPVLDRDPSLDIAELLAASKKVEEQIKQNREIVNSDLATQITEILTLNQQALGEDLVGLEGTTQTTLDGLKELEGDGETNLESILDGFLINTDTEKNLSAPFQRILKAIENFRASDEPLIIGTNLTPEQITQIQQRIEEIIQHKGKITKDDIADLPVAGIFAAIVQLLPPQAKPEVIILSRGVVISDQRVNISQSATSQPANDQGAQLNTLLTSAPNTASGEKALNTDDFITGRDFKALLKEMAGTAKEQNNSLSVVAKTATTEISSPQHTTNYLQGWPFTMTGSLFAPFEWGDDLAQRGIGSIINNPASLTNLVTQAHSAHQAHPTTQLIAVALQQQAANGQNKTMTLQLDPPELGRVEVRMEFSKDKMMKAHMVVEKPETFAMLQRDTHILDKTIQEIGLDSDGGISLELAENGFDFSQNGGHDGSNGGAGNTNQDEAIEIVEATMNWHVDPDTGHTHYSILA